MWIKFLKETKRCVLLSFLAFKDTTLESTSRTFYCFFHCNSKRHCWCQKLVFFISGNTLIGDLHYANIRQTFFNERLPREGVLNHASKKFHRKKLHHGKLLMSVHNKQSANFTTRNKYLIYSTNLRVYVKSPRCFFF